MSAWSAMTAMTKKSEVDGTDRAGVVGADPASVGLEADQPDRDWASSDQGVMIGRSGCDRGAIGTTNL